MWCDFEEILQRYAKSDWYSRLNMYCHYRDLRPEMTKIDKNESDHCLTKENKISRIASITPINVRWKNAGIKPK